MNIPTYKVPLPKGTSKEAIDLSEEVNKWANIEVELSLQANDLEMLLYEIGEDHKRARTIKAILAEQEAAAEEAEAKYEKALHKMCEAL